MGRKGIEVVVSELEREQLLSMSRSRSLPHSLVRRAKIVLMAADGHTTTEIAMQCELTPPAITHWKKRFVAQGLAGLHDEARPGRPRTHDDEAVAELLARVLHGKPDGATHWSVRSAAAQTGDFEKFGCPVSVAVRYTAPSFKELQAVYRFILRREGARYCRTVPEPAHQRPGAVRRREEPVSGAGAHAADAADGAGLSRRGDA